MNIKEKLQLENLKGEDLQKILREATITELCEEWNAFSDEEGLKIILNLDLEDRVDLLNELSYGDQERLVTDMSEQHFKQILDEMEPDDITDFMQSVSQEIRQAVWQNLSAEARRETLFLLRFDEDDAAGLMTPRYLAIRSTINVGQALSFLRKNAGEVETVYYLYIVDDLQRLLGVVSVRDLLSAADSTPIKDLMETHYIAVDPETDQEEAARILQAYDLLALPVTDRHNKLLGIITFDDVIDVIREENTEDVYKMGAMDGSIDRYLDSSIWALVKKRVPWLIILLLVGTITTNVLKHYENMILSAAFLSIFIPVITQTGGNSGSQSSTLMIRGLATGELHTRDAGRIFLRECFVGVLMGIITGIVILSRSLFLPPGITLFQGIVVGLSLSLVVLFSTLIGAMAPLLIKRLGFDPTVMSAPLMATLIDVCGITIYFELARRILGI